MVEAGWLEFTSVGYLEDGQYVEDESLLLQVPYPAGFIRNQLLGGLGELGGLVRGMALADLATYDLAWSRRAHLM